MSDVTTFAELFGAVFPAENETQAGVVYGPLGDDLTGTAMLVSPPASNVCNVSLFVRKHIGGDPFEGVLVEARHPTGLAIKGSGVSLNSSVTGTTNGSGFLLLVLARQAQYRLSFKGKEGTTFSVDITVPNTESATIEQTL